MTIYRLTNISDGFAEVWRTSDSGYVGYVQRGSRAYEARPGEVREQRGWAGVPVYMGNVTDPVQTAGAALFPTRREAAEHLATNEPAITT